MKQTFFGSLEAVKQDRRETMASSRDEWKNLLGSENEEIWKDQDRRWCSPSSQHHHHLTYDDLTISRYVHPPPTRIFLSFARATALPLNAIISHISHIAFLLFSPKQRCRFFFHLKILMWNDVALLSLLRFELNTCEIMSENGGEDVERSREVARGRKSLSIINEMERKIYTYFCRRANES